MPKVLIGREKPESYRQGMIRVAVQETSGPTPFADLSEKIFFKV